MHGPAAVAPNELVVKNMSEVSPKVSIIVVSYNTRDMTLACLRSVLEQTVSTSFELLVLDNASSDGSAQAIFNEFSNSINLVASASNLGFAAGNNIMATRAKGEYRRFIHVSPHDSSH